MSKVLEKTFDVDSQLDIEDEVCIEIPENASLNDIKNIALKAYEIQLKNINKIEPKYRGRAFEVANQTLNAAITAGHHAEDVRLKEMKIKPPEEGAAIVRGKSRRELAEEISRKKREGGSGE